ncbi:DUF7266 family protein [Halomarina litorea]|uniref:DUF7266 family protein n=1 Tax=Halomarina litorea TaxID=2961595 RepID=UPI0020C47F08|nr:hypothetical protein [Halomarina sp. BCD28]
MTRDTRATSTTLGYVLTLGITSILITGLLMGAGGMVEDQRERTIRSELQVVGQMVAADVSAADRLAQAGDATFAIRRDVPPTVAGATYTVEVVVDDPENFPPTDTYLRLSTSNPSVTVEVDMALQSTLVESSLTGDRVVVTYDPATGLEVTDG